MAVGRPTKFTPIIREGIISALRAGNTRTAASEAVGINRGTLAEWIESFPAFSSEVKEAEAYAEQEAVKRITSAMGSQWTAAAWWLERRKPNEWGKVDRIEVTIRDQAEKLANELGVSVDDVLREAELIANGRG